MWSPLGVHHQAATECLMTRTCLVRPWMLSLCFIEEGHTRKLKIESVTRLFHCRKLFYGDESSERLASMQGVKRQYSTNLHAILTGGYFEVIPHSPHSFILTT